eukprot:5756000-Pyramimonas_sp.AAC.1
MISAIESECCETEVVHCAAYASRATEDFNNGRRPSDVRDMVHDAMGQPIKHHWRIIVIDVVQSTALRSHARCPVECWGADRQGPRGLAREQQG